jgi:hypothetical protein
MGVSPGTSAEQWQTASPQDVPSSREVAALQQGVRAGVGLGLHSCLALGVMEVKRWVTVALTGDEGEIFLSCALRCTPARIYEPAPQPTPHSTHIHTGRQVSRVGQNRIWHFRIRYYTVYIYRICNV